MSHAQMDTLRPKTDVKHVTVFFNGAEVERGVNRYVKAGKHIILLDSLPEEIDPQSIQATPEGRLKILSVQHRLSYPIGNNKSQKENEIEASVDGDLLKVEVIKNEIRSLLIEEKILLENSDLSSKVKGISVEQLKAAGQFYRSKMKEIGERRLRLKTEADSLNEGIQAKFAQIGRLTAKSSKVYSQILVAVESFSSARESITIGYYVPTAGWQPFYDFRVQDVDMPTTLVYNAKVYQTTGEDWKKTNVTLSSKNPALTNDKPKLEPWHVERRSEPKIEMVEIPRHNGSTGSLKGKVVDKNNGEALPFINIQLFMDGESAGGGTTDFDGNYSIKPLSPGNYDVNVSCVGYNARQITDVVIKPHKSTFLDVSMTSGINLEAVEIVKYTVPIIDKDNTASGGSISFSSNSSSRTPRRSAKSIAETTAGVSIRGSRTGGDFVYIDGVKVRGANNLPKSAIQSTSVITGGLPANYSSIDGGVRGGRNTGYSSGVRRSSSNLTRSAIASGSKGLLSAIAERQVKRSIESPQYAIDIPYTILSNGEDNIIKIKEEDLNVGYIYQSVPKLQEDVFLSAQVYDWSELNLLTGSANVYFKGTYTGTTFIDSKELSDTLSVSISREQGIMVERKVNKELNDKRVLGNNFKENLVWDIEVKNNRSNLVNLWLEDQYPITEKTSIEIELLESNGAEVDEKTGKLLWKLTLEPGESKKLNYSYSIKYPKYQQLYGN
jgi:hypothetical protein